MPSYLGRPFGLSFRAELLIMNLLGLVNSTLDWSRVKWTNQLEQIWNLSLSQESFIIHTIGEDTIKTVLSWIVITRIVTAHMYTLTYLINVYPIITWSRPMYLLPWLILSFIKNALLEVIVIVIGLCLWYEQKFSLLLFVEFIFVKFVPLILSAYHWYANSCLYRHLRYAEKMRKLKRSMKSDTNIITNRLYAKIEDSIYRTRSLTTLLSYESYESYDTQDTISQIIDNQHLSPMEKTMRILGLSEQDIAAARVRIKEHARHRKLTEVDETSFPYNNSRKNSSRYFSFHNNNEDYTLKKIEEEENSIVVENKNEDKQDITQKVDDLLCKEDTTTDNSLKKQDSTIESRLPRKKRESMEHVDANKTKQMKLSSSYHSDSLGTGASLLKKRGTRRKCCSILSKKYIDNCCSPVKLQALFNCNCTFHGHSTDEPAELCYLVDEGIVKTSTPTKNPSEGKTNESYRLDDLENTRESLDTELNAIDNFPATEKMFENNCDLLNCVQDEENQKSLMKEDNFAQESEFIRDKSKTFSEDKTNAHYCVIHLENHNERFNETFFHTCNTMDLETELKTIDNFTATENIFNNNCELENSVQHEEDRKALITEDRFVHENSFRADRSKNFPEYCDTLISVKHLSNIRQDLDIVQNEETESVALKRIENNGNSTVGIQNELLKMVVVSESSFKNNSNKLQDDDSKIVKESSPNIEFLETVIDKENIPKYYQDFMKVFDGCYEKGFERNSELQCLLQQMEKKQWNLFTGQPNFEYLPRIAFLNPIENFDHFEMKKNLKDHSISSRNLEKIERSKDPESSQINKSPKKETALTSEKNEASDDSQDCTSIKSIDIKKTNSVDQIKHVHTQTGDDLSSKSSNLSLADTKKRKKAFWKHKRLKDQSTNVSPTNKTGPRFNKPQPQSSLPADNASLARNDSKSKNSLLKSSAKVDQINRQPSATKSLSNQSICECKLQKIAARYSTSSESKFNGNKGSQSVKEKPTVDSFATLPFSQVSGVPGVGNMVFRRKPPACPKKIQNEATVSKKPPFTQKQWSSGESNKLKSKNRVESLEGKKAEELRALKAYNEVTLLKDKKELEEKRKESLKRNVDLAEHRRNSRWQQSSLNRFKKDVDVLFDDYLNKENYFTESTTETNSTSVASFSKDDRPILNKESFNVSGEKYTCSNLRKINKVTDELLDNFDRLRGSQTKQELKGRQQTSNVASRKQYTKYSTPRRQNEEKSVSASSSKKIEGAQKGRELDRTPAKEDVRDQSMEGPGLVSVIDQLPRMEAHERQRNIIDKEGKHEGDFGLSKIKSDIDKEIDSTQSSNTVDETNRWQRPVDEINVEESLKIQDDSKQIPGRVDMIEDTKIPLNIEKKIRKERSGERLHFDTNIDVSYHGNGVILANKYDQGNIIQGSIVQDGTARLLHNAFSYKSMDSIVDVENENLSFGSSLTNSRFNTVSNEFVCQPRNDTVDFLQPKSIEQVCIIALNHEDPSTNTETEVVDALDNTEETEFEIVDLDFRQLELDNIIDLNFHVLPKVSIDNQAADSRYQAPILENIDNEAFKAQEKVEKELEENEKILRFIKEDVFTNIKFPIVIKKSDLLSHVLNFRNEDSARLHTQRLSAIETNLGSMVENRREEKEKFDQVAEEEHVEEYKRFVGQVERQNEQKIDLYMALTVIPASRSRLSSENYVDVGKENSLKDQDLEGKVLPISFPASKSLELKSESAEVRLNATFDVSKPEYVGNEEDICLQEDKNNKETAKANQNTEDSIKNGATEEMERNCVYVDLETSGQRDEMYRNIELLGFEDEEEELMKLIGSRESVEINNETFVISKELEGNLTFDVGKINETSEVKEEVTLKIAFIFWMMVFLFYIKYFYQKILSFAQVEQSTSTGRPFEIHTLPTSTSSFLEKAELVENTVHQDDETREENLELLERSIDLENEKSSTSNEDHVQSNLSEFSDEQLSNVFEIDHKDSFEEIKTEVRRLSNLSKVISENTQDVEVVLSDHSSCDQDVQQDFLSTENRTNNELLNSASKSDEISMKCTLSIFESNERSLRELNFAEEEKMIFRFKELDDSSSSKSLLEREESENNRSADVATTKVEIENVDLDVDLEKVDTGIESDPLHVGNKEEFHEESKDKEEILNQAMKDSSKPGDSIVPRFFESVPQEVDSFDSSYTRASEMSENTLPLSDLVTSSMEDFSITSNTSTKVNNI